jgi:5-methylcytosine-specific restriction endonuclease McrA
VKTCTRCGEVKSHESFSRAAQKNDGLQPYCKVCVRDYNRKNKRTVYEYKRRDATRYREYAALGASRRRARRRNVPHEPYSRSELFERWGYLCCYCDAPATDVEHIKPISRGGADALHNLTVACSSCNGSKGAKTLAEWAATF